MKFILTSNSYLVTKEWSKEFGMKPNKLSVAFIDTAADVYNKAEADWLKADRDALTNVGFTVTDYSLVDKTKDQLTKDLSKFDVFFVSGGNTFYLLEKSNKSGFTELIKEDYFKDKIYVGSSAGSVLLSNNIDPIKFIDDPKKASLENNKAIGIFNFTIFPHWGNSYFKDKYVKATEYAYANSQQALLLADNQYLLYSNKEFNLISI
ncbi:MAG: peptidase E [Candidatus Pacebacteria bacterium]|nr:peptidase E [Candidatus Paceibacterota bacterium]